MKKSLLLFSLLIGSVNGQEKPIECQKLLDLIRQAATLDDKFVEIVGNLEEREEKLYQSWQEMTTQQRENAEQLCAKTATELADAMRNFQSPKQNATPLEKPDYFPPACEAVITLSEKAQSLLKDEELLANIEELKQNLFSTWQETDEEGKQKIIDVCQTTQQDLEESLQQEKPSNNEQ